MVVGSAGGQRSERILTLFFEGLPQCKLHRDLCEVPFFWNCACGNYSNGKSVGYGWESCPAFPT